MYRIPEIPFQPAPIYFKKNDYSKYLLGVVTICSFIITAVMIFI
jgi:hypothetical protein